MEVMNKEALYQAFVSRDARFDGRFFVGVKSTGIYCRSICSAKMPKYENCNFYSTAAEAETAGFRPCLHCRPELAPGYGLIDASGNLARRAAKLIEENCGITENLGDIAQRLGCTDRHLRRVFEAEYHVKPIEYLQTCRLHLAKSLLTDTNLPMIQVALASGYKSVRRFNSVFQENYHLPPSHLRKNAKKGSNQGDTITLALGYRPPYRWDLLLDFFSLRAIPGVEVVTDKTYARTVHLVTAEGQDIYGWFRAENDGKRSRLKITLSTELLPVLPLVMGRIRNLFDLYCDPHVVGNTLQSMNEIMPDLYIPGIRIPGCFDAFEMCTRAILGQQITVKAATTLAGRLATAYGHPVETGVEGLTTTAPTAEDILALGEPVEDRLGPLGIIGTRAKSIQALAGLIGNKEIDFVSSPEPEAAIEKLVALPGIGPWTANYIAMRSMGWTDGFSRNGSWHKKSVGAQKTKGDYCSGREVETMACLCCHVHLE